VFPPWSRCSSWMFSLYFHIWILLWDSPFILKLCPCHVVILFINLSSEVFIYKTSLAFLFLIVSWFLPMYFLKISSLLL
jgi:hypothetical protein